MSVPTAKAERQDEPAGQRITEEAEALRGLNLRLVEWIGEVLAEAREVAQKVTADIWQTLDDDPHDDHAR
jgi:hypothetical protein